MDLKRWVLLTIVTAGCTCLTHTLMKVHAYLNKRVMLTLNDAMWSFKRAH